MIANGKSLLILTLFLCLLEMVTPQIRNCRGTFPHPNCRRIDPPDGKPPNDCLGADGKKLPCGFGAQEENWECVQQQGVFIVGGPGVSGKCLRRCYAGKCPGDKIKMIDCDDVTNNPGFEDAIMVGRTACSKTCGVGKIHEIYLNDDLKPGEDKFIHCSKKCCCDICLGQVGGTGKSPCLEFLFGMNAAVFADACGRVLVPVTA